MDNIVQITNDLYINIAEAVTIQAGNGQSFGIGLREGDGSITVHYCHPDSPGYAKLKKLLAKAK